MVMESPDKSDNGGSHNPLVAEAMKQGAIPEGYREIEVDFFQFKKAGDMVTGQLVNKAQIQVKGGRVGKYTINKADNKKVAFLGSVQLDELMSNVNIGARIQVVYVSDETLENKNVMKKFKLYVK